MSDGELTALILVAAFMAFLTRVGGHLILVRFTPLHPRVEAALQAVPVAVLGALIAPAILLGGPAELVASIVAGLIALRASTAWVIACGVVVLVVLRRLAEG